MPPWEKYQQQGTTSAPAGPWNKYAPPKTEEDEPQWSDLPGNIIPSAGKLISDTAAAINPYNWDDIAANLYELGPSGIANFFKERYYDNPKKTLIEDPLGVVADAAGLFTGVGAGARLPGTAGRIAATAGKAGKAIDPLTGAVPQAVAQKAGQWAGKATGAVAGVTTGAGEKPFRIAAEAGFEGGQKARAFKESLNNKVEPETIVAGARGAVEKIKYDRALAYQDGMRQILADKTPLSFAPIRAALDKAADIRAFTAHGHTRRAPKQSPVIREMNKIITTWEQLSAKKGKGFSTMGAFDSMKRELNDVRLAYGQGTPQRAAADRLYNAVRDSINDMSKTKNIMVGGKKTTYGDVMKAYDAASDQIDELQRTLSLKDGSTVDTALRKLQSVMRDTAHTNYGARSNLVQLLVDNGAHDLLQHLAGQALRPGLRPGLAAQVGTLGTLGAVFGGGLSTSLLATLALYSPNLMGRGAYVSGNVAGKIVKPALDWEKFLQDRGLSSRGIAMAGRQVGMLEDAGEEQGQARVRFGQALTARAQELGYNIHPSVIDSLAADLASENREDYERGIRTIGSNPRIAKMIMEAGGQGG